jgi:hydrolase, NUDIX family
MTQERFLTEKNIAHNSEGEAKAGWHTAFAGMMFDVQHNDKGWERVVRAPGVRIILDDQNSGKILLTREFRHELDGYDYRLPGGKVFDSRADYQAARAQHIDIIQAATTKAVHEVQEEAGYTIVDPQLIHTSTLGATVKWDLYTFVATNFIKSDDGQQLEDGEVIQTDLWFSYGEVREMALKGDMREDRIAMVLLRYLYSNDFIDRNKGEVA